MMVESSTVDASAKAPAGGSARSRSTKAAVSSGSKSGVCREASLRAECASTDAPNQTKARCVSCLLDRVLGSTGLWQLHRAWLTSTAMEDIKRNVASLSASAEQLQWQSESM